MNRRLLLASLVASLGLAACTGGERNQTGECPADEACSPLTPDGLHFIGPTLVGVLPLAQPKVTAVDGTQLIRLYLGGGEEPTDRPINLPFAAMTDNGDALAVDGTGPTTVTVSGVAPGADLLRITEADNDLLYDRYEIDAAALDTIELVAGVFAPGAYERRDPALSIGFYLGEVTLGIALSSASDVRLVDDSMTLDAPGMAMTRDEWDTFTFADLGVGTHSPTLTAAGRSGPIDIVVVDAVTQVLPLLDTFQDTIRVDDIGDVCFHASGGGRDAIFGLPWSFSTTGAVIPQASFDENCFRLQVGAPGEFSVTATTLGEEATLTLTAIAAGGKPAGAAAPAPAPERIAPEGDTRGERAQLAQP
jgi:hypothetical protein